MVSSMWENIFDLAINNGLWAVLFLGLLIYQLKDSRTREVKYQSIITSLTDKLDLIQKVSEDVSDIKDSIKELKNKSKKCEEKECLKVSNFG